MATNKNTALKVGAVRYVGLMLHIRWAGGWHLGGLILDQHSHPDTQSQHFTLHAPAHILTAQCAQAGRGPYHSFQTGPQGAA